MIIRLDSRTPSPSNVELRESETSAISAGLVNLEPGSGSLFDGKSRQVLISEILRKDHYLSGSRG